MSNAAVSLPQESSPAKAGDAVRLQLPRWMVWSVGVAIVLTYLCLLGGFSLAEPDEPRYAEITREMIELHDWVTPHLNYVKYFEKPPFVYWLTAVNFELFGMSEFVARLWPALFGLIGIMTAYVLGRSMYGVWTGYAAAALLATTPFYFGLSQILTLDMPLTALMTLGLAAFWFAYKCGREPHPSRRSQEQGPPQGERKLSFEHTNRTARPEEPPSSGGVSKGARWRRPGRRVLVLLLYVATALGVLTKGPVAAVLIGGSIVSFLILQRDLRALRWLPSPLGIVVFLAITLPWFVLVSRRNPEFLDFFVVDQHLKRFLAPSEHRHGLWFFLPIVWGGILPWSAFVLFAPGMLRQFGARLLRRQLSAATQFCLAWSGVILLFFSLSGSKLATYVLPIFCPLAILAARFFERVLEEKQHCILIRGCVALLVFAAVTALGGAVAGAVLDQPEVAIIIPHVYAGSCVIALTACTALILLQRRSPQAGLAVLVLGVLVLEMAAISGRGVRAHYRHLGVTIDQEAGPQDLVILYNHYVQGVPFYARRRAVVVGGHGELDFGSHQGNQGAYFWDNNEQLFQAWRSPRHVFLVINRLELEPLLPRLQPTPRQIAAESKKVLIVNFAG
ncbi:MAG: phospholipid carrier-dependent glycosyltransferase [Candidatus Binatia bacterium]